MFQRHLETIQIQRLAGRPILEEAGRSFVPLECRSGACAPLLVVFLRAVYWLFRSLYSFTACSTSLLSVWEKVPLVSRWISSSGKLILISALPSYLRLAAIFTVIVMVELVFILFVLSLLVYYLILIIAYVFKKSIGFINSNQILMLQMTEVEWQRVSQS